MALYEKERKRKDIIPPSERKAAQVQAEAPEASTRRRRKSSTSKAGDTEGDDQTEADDEDATVTQKRGRSTGSRKASVKREKSKSASVRAAEEEEEEEEEVEEVASCIIATTSVDITNAQMKKLAAIPGVKRTGDPTKCTHLVASAFKRTPKFLQALSHAPYIVTKGWIDACAKKGSLVDEKPYLLKDKVAEDNLGISLAEVLDRAKESQQSGGLLAGKTVILIDNVEKKLPPSDFVSIIASAGGTGLTPNASKLSVLPKNIAGHMVMSYPEDKIHWQRYAQAGIPVFGKEGILGAIFKMKLDMDFDRLDKK